MSNYTHILFCYTYPPLTLNEYTYLHNIHRSAILHTYRYEHVSHFDLSAVTTQLSQNVLSFCNICIVQEVFIPFYIFSNQSYTVFMSCPLALEFLLILYSCTAIQMLPLLLLMMMLLMFAVGDSVADVSAVGWWFFAEPYTVQFSFHIGMQYIQNGIHNIANISKPKTPYHPSSLTGRIPQTLTTYLPLLVFRIFCLNIDAYGNRIVN